MQLIDLLIWKSFQELQRKSKISKKILIWKSQENLFSKFVEF